ncbi:MAG: hypothetical protein HY737_01920 [Candidatus Omnitrophica bacterium]|nr:hypothetical protein [Candidatus Omnitrophota bacterium]
MEASSEPAITFHYRFIFPDHTERAFTVRLDPATLAWIPPASPAPLPAWTRLSFQQCPNCPLREAESPQCPAAVSVVELISAFKQSLSIERVTVVVETPERQHAKQTSLQEGISSLLGIHMVTSGCPVMAKLKPMVRFHLPFSTIDETRYRVLSMYLLGQYLRSLKGQPADWPLKQLAEFYREVQTVNNHFFKRLTKVDIEDASLNAIVRLDAGANVIEFELDRHLLNELEQLFQPYF